MTLLFSLIAVIVLGTWRCTQFPQEDLNPQWLTPDCGPSSFLFGDQQNSFDLLHNIVPSLVSLVSRLGDQIRPARCKHRNKEDVRDWTRVHREGTWVIWDGTDLNRTTLCGSVAFCALLLSLSFCFYVHISFSICLSLSIFLLRLFLLVSPSAGCPHLISA